MDLSEVVGENAPSTFGTFIATMCKSIAVHCGELQEIDAISYGKMLNWAAEGVMKRGGGKARRQNSVRCTYSCQ